jgi:hypothetical protein
LTGAAKAAILVYTRIFKITLAFLLRLYYALAVDINFMETTMQKITISRNKREGRYAGKRAYYKFSDCNDDAIKFPTKHWRVGSWGFDSLKSYGKFLRSIGE